MSSKHELGQYYTTTNPFKGDAFVEWEELSGLGDSTILEPFAGAGNIFEFFPDQTFVGYDIEPNNDGIVQRDTLQNFPTGYKTCITNPPYLAKNSISRNKLDVKIKYEDLYLDCLEKMLENCDYVAAIIPSTFYNTGLFRNRLFAWDKHDYQLFSDTDTPAGVAYFVPENTNTNIYVNGEKIEHWTASSKNSELKFNVSNGNYIFNAIDKTGSENIGIEPVNNSFDRDKFLKNTSRNYSLFYSPTELDCDLVNENINEWRKTTKDFYLTSFKSMMRAGKYRKRMGFDLLRNFC